MIPDRTAYIYILNGSLEEPRQSFRWGKPLNILLNSLRPLHITATGVIATTEKRIMTTLAAKHDAFGGGDLRMGASSPFELVDKKEEDNEKVQRIRRYNQAQPATGLRIEP